jgi:hypothetical protein
MVQKSTKRRPCHTVLVSYLSMPRMHADVAEKESLRGVLPVCIYMIYILAMTTCSSVRLLWAKPHVLNILYAVWIA